MGMTAAGIIFKLKSDLSDTEILSLINDCVYSDIEKVESPIFGINNFDIRHDSDFVISRERNNCFIANSDIVRKILSSTEYAEKIYSLLNSPPLFVAYYIYDSGGSYGYAVYESGVKRFSRIQNFDEPMIVTGEPTEIERKWVNAKTYEEKDEEYPDDEGQILYYIDDSEERHSAESLTVTMIEKTLDFYFDYDICNPCSENESFYHIKPPVTLREPKNKPSFFQQLLRKIFNR